MASRVVCISAVHQDAQMLCILAIEIICRDNRGHAATALPCSSENLAVFTRLSHLALARDMCPPSHNVALTDLCVLISAAGRNNNNALIISRRVLLRGNSSREPGKTDGETSRSPMTTRTSERVTAMDLRARADRFSLLAGFLLARRDATRLYASGIEHKMTPASRGFIARLLRYKLRIRYKRGN